MAPQRDIKQNFGDHPDATALATVNECLKAVRRLLRCIASDRIHSRNLILEADLELAAANNDSKEPCKRARALAPRSLSETELDVFFNLDP